MKEIQKIRIFDWFKLTEQINKQMDVTILNYYNQYKLLNILFILSCPLFLGLPNTQIMTNLSIPKFLIHIHIQTVDFFS